MEMIWMIVALVCNIVALISLLVAQWHLNKCLKALERTRYTPAEFVVKALEAGGVDVTDMKRETGRCHVEPHKLGGVVQLHVPRYQAGKECKPQGECK